jgi:hypothetical protein
MPPFPLAHYSSFTRLSPGYSLIVTLLCCNPEQEQNLSHLLGNKLVRLPHNFVCCHIYDSRVIQKHHVSQNVILPPSHYLGALG